jgi:hypothetical protein
VLSKSDFIDVCICSVRYYVFRPHGQAWRAIRHNHSKIGFSKAFFSSGMIPSKRFRKKTHELHPGVMHCEIGGRYVSAMSYRFVAPHLQIRGCTRRSSRMAYGTLWSRLLVLGSMTRRKGWTHLDSTSSFVPRPGASMPKIRRHMGDLGSKERSPADMICTRHSGNPCMGISDFVSR